MSHAERKINDRDSEFKLKNRYDRKQLGGLLFLLVVVVTMAGGGCLVILWMKNPDHLPLTRLVITGDRRFTTDEDIRQAILTQGGPKTFMTENVNLIQQQLERYPWIKQASIRKQWPNELKIYIVEYVPVARWNEVNLVNNEGTVFRLPKSEMTKLTLPVLFGPEGTVKEVLKQYQLINHLLSQVDLKLDSIRLNERSAWVVKLNNNIKLFLGKSEYLQRIKRFITVYPVLVQQGKAVHKQIDYVDLRYDSGIAVGWGANNPEKNETGGKSRAHD